MLDVRNRARREALGVRAGRCSAPARPPCVSTWLYSSCTRFSLCGRNGEDAGAKRAAAHVFEQSRVPATAHDILIDAPRLVAVEQLALEALPVDVHRKLRHGGVFRQGEDVGALQLIARLVDEHLVDPSDRHLVVNRTSTRWYFTASIGTSWIGMSGGGTGMIRPSAWATPANAVSQTAKTNRIE